MSKENNYDTSKPYSLDGDFAISRSKGKSNRREYEIRLIKAGRVRAAGNRESNVEVPIKPLRKALNKRMFNDLAVFCDHTGWFEYPKTDRMIGSVQKAWRDGDAILGELKVFDTPFANAAADMFDNLLEDGDSGPDVGFSLVFWPVWAPRDNFDDPLVLKEIKHVESCDFVFEPGADGRLLAKLSAHLVPTKEQEVKIMSDQIEEPTVNEELQAPEAREADVPAESAEARSQSDAWLARTVYSSWDLRRLPLCRLQSPRNRNISLRCNLTAWSMLADLRHAIEGSSSA
jgi:hypothetical protein